MKSLRTIKLIAIATLLFGIAAAMSIRFVETRSYHPSGKPWYFVVVSPNSTSSFSVVEPWSSASLRRLEGEKDSLGVASRIEILQENPAPLGGASELAAYLSKVKRLSRELSEQPFTFGSLTIDSVRCVGHPDAGRYEFEIETFGAPAKLICKYSIVKGTLHYDGIYWINTKPLALCLSVLAVGYGLAIAGALVPSHRQKATHVTSPPKTGPD